MGLRVLQEGSRPFSQRPKPLLTAQIHCLCKTACKHGLLMVPSSSVQSSSLGLWLRVGSGAKRLSVEVREVHGSLLLLSCIT